MTKEGKNSCMWQKIGKNEFFLLVAIYLHPSINYNDYNSMRWILLIINPRKSVNLACQHPPVRGGRDCSWESADVARSHPSVNGPKQETRSRRKHVHVRGAHKQGTAFPPSRARLFSGPVSESSRPLRLWLISLHRSQFFFLKKGVFELLRF